MAVPRPLLPPLAALLAASILAATMVLAAAGPAAARSAAPTGGTGIVAVVAAADGTLSVERFVSAAGTTAEDAVAAVAARPGVVAADVDVPTVALGGDPLRAEQWPLDTLRAERVWSASTGMGVTVAVLDSGVEATHPDLRSAVVAGADFTGAGGDGRRDVRGHGTHVAGIVAAARGNGVGVAGLAPGVRVLPARVLDDAGSGLLSWAAEAIIWAADRGADVVTMSLGASRGSAVLDAAVAHATRRGAVLVAASGNQGATRAMWPAAHRDVISVGASTPEDRVADFSNADPSLDLVAPGTGVLSTCTGGRWCTMRGTSMATPYVAAAAAAVRSLRPHLAPAEVRAHLQRTAVDLGRRGHDADSGWGRLDADAALRALPPAVDPFLASGSGLRRVAGVTGASAVSVATSQATFPDSASTAVVARDDVFADSLAGAGLGGRRGPVLFTTGGPDATLAPGIAAELRRLLAPGATVHVLGGPAAVSERAAAQIADLGFAVVRTGGASRVETAAAVAALLRASAHPGSPLPGGGVLLARADQWVDAVTAGAYAAGTGTPVLLSDSRRLDVATRAWLAAHDPDEVVIVGGEVAVSAGVSREIAGMGLRVRRVGGPDRAATAAAVARELWGRRAGAPGDGFVVVEGYSPQAWAPAVAGSVLSAATGAPQLLVAPDSVPAGTAAYLGDLRYGPDRTAEATAVGAGVRAAAGYALLPLIGR